MTQQLDTSANTNASASAAADAAAEAGASESMVDEVDAAMAAALADADARMAAEASAAAKVKVMVGAITTLFETTFSQLVALRDERYAAAIEELEQESNRLSEEYGQLEADIASLEAVLPSKERLTQHQIDTLLVEGKRYEVKDKLSELAAHKRKPVAMRERHKEIVAKLGDIDSEKQAATREVFDKWHAQCQRVVRAGERGLFLGLLEKLSADFSAFQERVGMAGSVDHRKRGLLAPGHFSNLTADVRSPEWAAGSYWYGSRRWQWQYLASGTEHEFEA